MNRIWKKWNH